MKAWNNAKSIGGLRLIRRPQAVIKTDFTVQAYLKAVGNRLLVNLHTDFVIVEAALCTGPLHSPTHLRLRLYIKNRISVPPGRPKPQTDCIAGVRLIGNPVIPGFITKQRFSINHTHHSLAFSFHFI